MSADLNHYDVIIVGAGASGLMCAIEAGKRQRKVLLLDHAERLCAWFGEPVGMLRMRKQATWYSKGFPGGAALRARLTSVKSLADLRTAVTHLPPETPFPPVAMRVRRGKGAGTQRVALPDGYLDDLDDDTPPVAAANLVADGGLSSLLRLGHLALEV